jgi:CubicO group peptidase (beta-lactamase class C family)
MISRRTFTTGALSAALGSQFVLPAYAQDNKYAGALAAIRAYGDAHISHFRLPGMTLGVTAPDGFSAVLNFRSANPNAPNDFTDDTLVQIGSISKLITGAILHQLAAEGRVKLTDRLSDLLPGIPLPPGNAIHVQHLLDHVAGIPGDAPIFPDGGLWTAYAPGAHWHYSNTGYQILGKLIEHLERRPLARVVQARILQPLGMRRSRGAIVGADRGLYAQGYEAADQQPFAIGVPLAPAAWVDVTFGAGNVASTAEDMNRLLRSLADAVQGRGGLGLPPQAAQAYAIRAVASDRPGMSYGNGLMHVANGGRSYLHHTGGMLSFASAFHVDVASGTGAFASSPIGAFSEYRPRLLTMFAADALTNAAEGRPVPAPPPLETPFANAASYVGTYSGREGSFEIRAGRPLTIIADGQAAPLQPWGGELFRTTHPSFRAFTFMFDRKGSSINSVSWGPSSYLRKGAMVALPASDAALAKFAGRYFNNDPWWGLMQVVERGGRLWIGTEVPMTRIGDQLWRVGEETWSPERASFANFIDGRPHSFIFSGEKFLRHDV